MKKYVNFDGVNFSEQTLVVGETGTGKTENVVKPMVAELLRLKSKGSPVKVTVVEPQANVSLMVAEMARLLGLEHTHIDEDLTDLENSFKNSDVLSIATGLGGDNSTNSFMYDLFQLEFLREDDIPHFLIVEEFDKYINPDTELFLSLAKEQGVFCILTTQSVSLLGVETGKFSAEAMKNSILSNCRNKILLTKAELKKKDEATRLFGEQAPFEKIISVCQFVKGDALQEVQFGV